MDKNAIKKYAVLPDTARKTCPLVLMNRMKGALN